MTAPHDARNIFYPSATIGSMTKVHVLRVFADSSGNFGDTATVIIDEGKQISDAKRQAITRQINTAETTFVNDIASANISIMHTQGEIDFAGVPAIGAAWLLSKLDGKSITAMKGGAGDINVKQDGELTWVRASLATMPPWHHKKLENAQAVERIALYETKTWEHTMVWAWIDEARGLIRARTFATDWGILEAEGNGSSAMLLAATVNKSIEVKHGAGSVIFANPASNGCADVGGRVAKEPSTNV